ncbi:septal ring lytic transglycosylase RlpA family protein [Pseudidiomarina donghaiensis]|nr:septal ring lytic transglycosylase RlpA family protein [Pseudidiomarina donghaiensis]SFV21460.1 rare lipoprotein A [Pseudidiomarina donghaiensis]
MMNASRFISFCSVVLLLAACSSAPPSRYSQKHDSIPSRLPSPEELVEPTPSFEPPSRQGNRTYSLFGKTWHILDDVNEFSQEGVASWYGEKFHGHLTSNGETYDMYAMSAAHKTLPLPTYVRVTNLSNNKSVVVRVNDRGPFHGNRIIDLSYVAAYKLDMLKSGTAKVRIEALQPSEANGALATTPPLTDSTTQQYYIQVHAGSDPERLKAEAEKLQNLYQVPATTQPNDGLYKLVLGPFAEPQTNSLLEQLRTQGYPDAFRVAVP